GEQRSSPRSWAQEVGSQGRGSCPNDIHRNHCGHSEHKGSNLWFHRRYRPSPCVPPIRRSLSKRVRTKKSRTYRRCRRSQSQKCSMSTCLSGRDGTAYVSFVRLHTVGPYRALEWRNKRGTRCWRSSH